MAPPRDVCEGRDSDPSEIGLQMIPGPWSTMSSCNQTRITEFVLLGIQGSMGLKYSLFALLSVTYIFTIAGNVLIIVLVLRSDKLHTPMYFFLCHLSFSDILLSTNVAPYLLCMLIGKCKSILVSSCLTQYFFGSSSAVSECFLLTAMSYDRYLAICSPLHYKTIMHMKFCIHLVVWSWSLVCLLNLSSVILMSRMEFCGCNIIDDLYCDHAPLLNASCSDTSIIELETIIFSIPIVLFPFLFVIMTYIRIFIAILKISTISGRRKAFSTCSSHMIVVAIYYGTLIAKYTAPPSGSSLNVNKVISLLYTVFTPLLNPAVYSLRNREIKEAMQKWVHVN
ncbi:PREDICTED: olfactory receptor 6B1-like [Nanorana parkeri]|uniref:olfactory receptor 6B1-like n=1 Tax=Nanorana parkeri TaxID=125878 RepID=UPI000854195C|nr:PREDICTED: olfactory receptor 6B1-like [Nanorana parkeri]